MTPPWAIWTGLALGATGLAFLLALVPLPLLREVTGAPGGWRRGATIGGPAMAAGLVTLLTCMILGRPPAVAAPLCAAAAVLAAVLVVDGRWMVAPDLYTAAIALTAVSAVGEIGWRSALIGALIGGGLLAAARWAFLHWRGVEGLGLGDVKLMAAVGLMVGAEALPLVIGAAALLGLVWIAALRSRIEGRLAAPFAACAAVPAFALFAARLAAS